MKVHTPLIAMLMASLFFTGAFTIFFSMADTYDINYDLSVFESQNGTSLEDSFDRLNQTKTEMEVLVGGIEGTTLTDQGAGGLFPFLGLAYKVGKQVFGSINIMKDVLNIVTELIGIPAVVTATLISIAIVVFGVMIVFILLGRTYSV